MRIAYVLVLITLWGLFVFKNRKSLKGLELPVRASEDRKIFGVCSAFGKKLDVEANVIRFLLLITPCGGFVYMLLAVLMKSPQEIDDEIE